MTYITRPTIAPDPRLVLAESAHYLIHYEYEVVFLRFKDGQRGDVVIGDFYGDPQTAYIAPDESYCVMGGCGLILYYLRPPFEEYSYDQQSANWREWGRPPDDIYWIETVYSLDAAAAIRFVVDLMSEAYKGVYELNLTDFTVEKLL